MSYDYEKERREAIAAGSRALDSLREAYMKLDSARGWGIYDIVGGGLFSSLIKHNKMDQAQEYLQAAKRDLKYFEAELQDLNNFENINLDTQDFLGFADLVFDGLFADVMMQNRINEARSKVSTAIYRVEDGLNRLQRPKTSS